MLNCSSVFVVLTQTLILNLISLSTVSLNSNISKSYNILLLEVC